MFLFMRMSFSDYHIKKKIHTNMLGTHFKQSPTIFHHKSTLYNVKQRICCQQVTFPGPLHSTVQWNDPFL